MQVAAFRLSVRQNCVFKFAASAAATRLAGGPAVVHLPNPRRPAASDQDSASNGGTRRARSHSEAGSSGRQLIQGRMEGATLPRVLSIQSHVVHGYVGNKCATFPLQLLGMEVDPIYSVQFSNHTGYPSWKGDVFKGEQLSALMQGLEDNGLLTHTHLLTGYIGGASLLNAIVEVIQKLKAHTPDLVYFCDPVMGDEGRLYVAPEMVEAFRDRLVPLASVMVPNCFEAELLIGPPQGAGRIASVADALRACAQLHARGPHTVVITSMSLPDDPHHIYLVASTTRPQDAGEEGQRLQMKIPKIPAYFTGTGDLLAALLLAWMHHHPRDLGLALEKAVGGLQAVLADTAAHCGPAALAAARTSEVCKVRELRLIANQAKLVDPEVKIRCTPVPGDVAAAAAAAAAARP